jgi:predicted GNAT family acetyltransferase
MLASLLAWNSRDKPGMDQRQARRIGMARRGVDVRDNPAKHRFEVDLGDSLAIADYALHPGKIIFIHTHVPAGREGQGIGTALIKAGLASARARGLKVVPVCPFFAAYIKQHAEEQDLLEPSSRERLGID